MFVDLSRDQDSRKRLTLNDFYDFNNFTLNDWTLAQSHSYKQQRFGLASVHVDTLWNVEGGLILYQTSL